MNIKNDSNEQIIKGFLAHITNRLNQLKEKVYHRRYSGSMLVSNDWVNCDCCGRRTKVKIGYEADYPKNPDMGLCSMCSDELDYLYNK